MITKERLKELIEQGATIYDKYGYKIDLAERDNFLENIFNIYFKVEQNQLYRMNKDLQIAEDQWYLQNLFETEEDAKWELEMTATYIDTLKLPTYEKLPKEFDIPPFIRYNKELENFVLYEMFNSTKNEICVLFRELDDDASNCLFEKPLTKENYIEACKLCLKLFKGE